MINSLPQSGSISGPVYHSAHWTAVFCRNS